MAGRILSFALVLGFGFGFVITVAQDDPPTLELGIGCSPDTYKYVNESAFHDNLDTAFESLATNISASNASFFSKAVSNKSDSDHVYALLLCRKYLTSNACLQCFKAANQTLRERCSDDGYNGGRVHLDGCFLRYENNTFFTKGTDGGFSNYCASVYDTKPQEFNETAETLLSQLAANASGSDGYAVGSTTIGSSTVYGVGQCVPTLSKTSCGECLEAARSIVVNNCLPKQKGRGLQAGCFMRYATDPFYDNSTSSNPNVPTSSSNSKFKTWCRLLGSTGAAAALLAALC